jgi:hypothetical protein
VKNESDKGISEEEEERRMTEKDINLKETKEPDNLRKGGRRERNIRIRSNIETKK